MEPMLALLPELNLIGTDTIASPKLWTRRTALRIPRLHFRKLPLEPRVRFDHRTLLGDRRAETAPQRTAREIRLGLSLAPLRTAPGAAPLPVQRRPVKHQRGAWILGQFTPLAAFVIGKEDEPTLI